MNFYILIFVVFEIIMTPFCVKSFRVRRSSNYKIISPGRHVFERPIHELRGLLFSNTGIFSRTANTKCPSSLNQFKINHKHLSIHPVCPWYYVENVDRTRYPRTVLEARCRCTDCLTNTGTSTVKLCTRVFTRISVLYNIQVSNKKIRGRRGSLRIATGCVCVLLNTLAKFRSLYGR